MVKYKYNCDIFENVNTEEGAYWLGFILADGYVSDGKKENLLQIKLSNKDKQHLVKFIQYLEYDTEDIIKECYGGSYTRDNLCNYVKIGNKKLVQDLHKYNLCGPKSGKEIPYIFSDDKLNLSYIRGIFDGDGYISTYDNRIGLVGSYDTCSYFKSFFERMLSIEFNNNVLSHSKIFRFNIYTKDLTNKVLNLMYKDANVYLDRKYQLYLDRIKS